MKVCVVHFVDNQKTTWYKGASLFVFASMGLALNHQPQLREGYDRKLREITRGGEPTGNHCVTPSELWDALLKRYYGDFCVLLGDACMRDRRPDLAQVAYAAAAEKYELEGSHDIAEAVRTAAAELIGGATAL